MPHMRPVQAAASSRTSLVVVWITLLAASQSKMLLTSAAAAAPFRTTSRRWLLPSQTTHAIKSSNRNRWMSSLLHSSPCCFVGVAPSNNISSRDDHAHRTKPQPVLYSTTRPLQDLSEEEELYSRSGYKRPSVSWYPGHIAKAERQLAETLKAVDVIVEVRDARACKATAHPRVGEWCAGKPRIVVLTHLDQIPKASFQSWKRSYESLGAEQWDSEVNAQVRNQALQAMGERAKRINNKERQQRHKNKGRDQKGRDQNVAAASPVENVLFVDAKQGQGIHALHRAIFKAGAYVQERRARRGLKDRPLRAGIIGFPNVGKSALINRILGRRRARTADTPGITRSLQWIRVRTDDNKESRRREFELLDSPGIIPANMLDQSDALLLAACNCIGQGAYDNQGVAAYLCEWLKTLHLMGKGSITSPEWRAKSMERYGFDPLAPVTTDKGAGIETDSEMNKKQLYRTGEDILFEVAQKTCRGDPEDASRKILQDFRTGRLGPISLQLAPQESTDDGQQQVPIQRGVAAMQGVMSTEELAALSDRQEQEREQERQERVKMAMKRAKEQGLELPPMVTENIDNAKENDANEDEVGKGLFDGW